MVRINGYSGGRSLRVLTPLDLTAKKLRSYVVSVINSNSTSLKVNRNKVLAAEAVREGGLRLQTKHWQYLQGNLH